VINHSHKNSLNKNVFKSFLKCGCICAWRTVSGSRFQAAGPACKNTRWPNFARSHKVA